jgi:hypothetical protein
VTHGDDRSRGRDRGGRGDRDGGERGERGERGGPRRTPDGASGRRGGSVSGREGRADSGRSPQPADAPRARQPYGRGNGASRRDDGPSRRGDGPSRRDDGSGRPFRRGDGPPREGDGRFRTGDGTGSGRRDRAPLGARAARPDDRARLHRDRPPRVREPEIPEDIDGRELDRAVWTELRTLSKENAEGVAQHLVAVSRFLVEEDLDRALAHAQTAGRRAGRVAAVREALGLVHYRRGEWAKALGEFRTARRLSGSNHLLPHLADCERGLGRPERAVALTSSPEARTLNREDRTELAIVVSGARRDLGQADAAVLELRDLVRATRAQTPGAPRLYYAYADALLDAGDATAAREWFSRALDADSELETDASERLAELDGVALIEIEDAEGDENDPAGQDDAPDDVDETTLTRRQDGPGE